MDFEGAVKTAILPGLGPGFQGKSHQINNKPIKMLAKPKKRIWPSLSAKSWVNMRRQPVGERKGKSPSTTNTKASATHKVSALKVYFLAAPAPLPPLRKTLKNSDDEGSSTIMSLLLAKLDL